MADDFGGIADDGAVWWNVGIENHCGRADFSMITDVTRAKDGGVGADEDIIADRGMAFAAVFTGAAEGDVVKNNAVVADFGGFADDDAHAVIDKKSLADFGTGMDFNAGEEAGNLGDEAREETEADFVKRMCEIFVKDDGVEARIKDRFKSAGGGIVFLDGTNFLNHWGLFFRREWKKFTDPFFVLSECGILRHFFLKHGNS